MWVSTRREGVESIMAKPVQYSLSELMLYIIGLSSNVFILKVSGCMRDRAQEMAITILFGTLIFVAALVLSKKSFEDSPDLRKWELPVFLSLNYLMVAVVWYFHWQSLPENR